MPRKVVSLASTAHALFALTDDSTVWQLNGSRWKQVTPVPCWTADSPTGLTLADLENLISVRAQTIVRRMYPDAINDLTDTRKLPLDPILEIEAIEWISQPNCGHTTTYEIIEAIDKLKAKIKPANQKAIA